jgi:hypothetical protein
MPGRYASVTVQPARLAPEYRTGFKLHHDRPPMRLWHKAKKLGVWNPRDIDFAQDAQDWRALQDHERDGLLRLSAVFLGGEESGRRPSTWRHSTASSTRSRASTPT